MEHIHNPKSKPDRPIIAYKILTADQWVKFQADGVFHGAPVDLVDGYIHLSTADQLDETLNKHFVGQSALVILAVDLAPLHNSIRWEISRGGALFPHIYAALPLSVVTVQQLNVAVTD